MMYELGVGGGPGSRRDRGPRPGLGARGRLAATATLSLAALVVSTLPASAAASAAPEAQGAAAPRLIAVHPSTGATAVALSPARRGQLLDEAARSAPATARSLRLGTQEKLIPKDVIQDADGTRHTRYTRTYAGLPVRGGDLVVHERAGGRTVTKASNAVISVPATTAEVPAATARKAALAAAEAERTRGTTVPGKPHLVVWASSGEPVLAWESVVTGTQPDGSPSSLRVTTDAADGHVLGHFEEVQSAVGHSEYSGQVDVTSTPLEDGTHALLDGRRGGHRTLDASRDSRGVLFTDDDDVWGDGAGASPQTAAVDAAYGAQQTWDFYSERFARNGIANDGRGSYSRVHYGDHLANANWQDGCFCMSYGDGGSGVNPVTSLDIAAHEMTHGVTSSTAGLGDEGESAALNESTSDMMAAAVEFFADNPADRPDYLVGEESDIRGNGKPIRYMDHPSKDADPVKGTSQDYWSPQTKNLDPHLGAGVGNHFFYLLAEGSGKKSINGVDYDSPTYDGSPVAGLGLRNATGIWYRALTVYMTSTTDYAAAREATLRAATDLYGRNSGAYEAVGNAWAAVNVGPRFVQHVAVASLPTGPVAVGQPVSRQIEATTSRPGSLTYSARRLPKGLSIDRHTGLISGTPKQAGDFRTTITIGTSAHDRRELPVVWTVLPSGGDHFVNPSSYTIPKWGTVESPLVVTGRNGLAPADVKVTVDLYKDFVGAQIITLVAEDGTVVPVKDFDWDHGTELHATYTVDASAVPADGTWRLRVQDATPGIPNADPEPGRLAGWSLDF